MRSILVSRRFNPGHLSHILANYELLTEAGYHCSLRINSYFFKFLPKKLFAQKTSLMDCIKLSKNDVFVVWFPSFAVCFDIMLVRFFTRATTVYVHHEPYTSFKAYYKSGFSLFASIRIILISFVSRLICVFSHKIILPSQSAFVAVPQAKSKISRYAKIPLMFLDESNVAQLHYTRKAISYIGTIAEDHAFEHYIRFAQLASEKRLLQEYVFLIATRSIIPDQYKETIDALMKNGRLSVQYGRPLSNEEINYFYANSFVVWNAYKRSMQSGVLPKAYMFGTPVIISELNNNEYFKNYQTGVMLSSKYSFDDFYQAVKVISLNWNDYSNHCRSIFLQQFHYKALATPFMNFISDKTC